MYKIIMTAILSFILIPPNIVIAYNRLLPLKDSLVNEHTALLNSYNMIEGMYLYKKQKNGHLNLFNYGVKLPLLYIQSSDDELLEFEMSAIGRATGRFQINRETYNFVHADWVGGFSFDIKYDQLITETIIYHTSSHIGDDAIALDGEPYVNSGWEAVKQYFNYRFADEFMGTVGVEYKLFRRPTNVIFYNLSFFLGAKFDFLPDGVPIFIDTELEVIDFSTSPNIGIRTGFYIQSIIYNVIFDEEKIEKQRLALFFQFYHGNTKIGYLYNTEEDLYIVGTSFRY